MRFIESCVTCGVLLQPADNKRRKRPSVLRRAVLESFTATPFVSKCVLALCENTDESVTIPMCMSCVHWLHRVQRREGGGRHMLPLDALLVFARLPFRAPPPDVRLLRRLVRALQSQVVVRGVRYHNPYRHLVEEGLQGILARYSGSGFRYGECVKAITMAHWERHGGGLSVGCKEEMRRLRRIPAAEVEQAFELLLGLGADACRS